jgi:hypothetical protein
VGGLGNKAFVYGGRGSVGAEVLIELNLDSFQLNQVGHPAHPQMMEYPSSVYDGSSFIYLIGGYATGSSLFGIGGFVQFDTVTRNSKFIPVKNFPVGDEKNGSWYEYAPFFGWVYKKTRLYCFGGGSQDDNSKEEFHDGIFYIDLLSCI